VRIRETSLVAAREVRSALRGRWFALAAGSFFALSLALSALGLAGARRAGLAGFDRTASSLLDLVLLFVPLMTLAIGALGIAGEVEDGSMAMLLAQPLTRAEVFAGKHLGLLAAIWMSILAGFGATGLVIGLIARSGDAGAFLWLVAIALLLAAATLGIGSALSALLGSRARAVGGAFTAWLFLVYGSDLGTIGIAIARDLGPARIFVLALVNPVQQARVLGMLALTRRLELLGPVGVYGLDRFGHAGLAALLVCLLLTTAILPAIAGWHRFREEVLS
jgi:Cu-processing system permease protein